MFSASVLYWDVPEDRKTKYSRCGWSVKQWEDFVMSVATPETKSLWQWVKGDIVKTRTGDDTSTDKIFRFATMTQAFAIKLRTFALSKGHSINLTGFELWESLTLARTAVNETKFWKTGSNQKVMNRICFIVSKWNTSCASESGKNAMNRFMSKMQKDESKREDSLAARPVAMPDRNGIYSTNIKGVKAQIISIDEWNNINWKPKEGDTLLISDAILYISLNLKIGIIRNCPLLSFDNACPKDASVKLCDISCMDTLFSAKELEEAINHNKSNGTKNQSIVDMHGEVVQYEKYLADLKAQQTTLQLVSNFVEHAKKLTLVLSCKEKISKDPFNHVFSMLGSYESICESLKLLYDHLQFEHTCLSNCDIVLKPFIVGYKWVESNDTNVSFAAKKIFEVLHQHLKDRSQKCAEFLKYSPFTQFISFWLKCIWSQHYIKNPVLNLKFDLSDIEWNNIPVSSFEMVCWHDSIYGQIREFRQPGKVRDEWYKYVTLKSFKVQGYIQILSYAMTNISSVIGEIELRMN